MELLIHERFDTLQAQVNALEGGTNPVVYFPPGTKRYPDLPLGMKRVQVGVYGLGEGVYYFDPHFTSEKAIVQSVEDGISHFLLGFVQSKQEAFSGNPQLLVARDKNGLELKSAVVDSSYLRTQSAMLRRQFPGCLVEIEDHNKVLQDRAEA